MRVMFDFDDVEPGWDIWPGGFISDDDGCYHCMVTDFDLPTWCDTFEIAVIPKEEARHMYE